MPPISGADPVLQKLIGTGARFPFKFDGAGSTSRVKLGRGVEKIQGSISHILSTLKGERFFLPQFGSNLPSLVFEPLDEITKDQVFLHTVGALKEWEPRLIVEAIGFNNNEWESDNSTISIIIEYRIIRSQVGGNYIFPWTRTTRPISGSEEELT